MADIVQFLYDSRNRATVKNYEKHLKVRGVEVDPVEPSQLKSILEGNRPLPRVAVIVCSGEAVKNRGFVKDIQAIDKMYSDKTGERWKPRVLMLEDLRLGGMLAGFRNINAFFLNFNRAFEELLQYIWGPFPRWLTLYCRPSLMSRPTGASWWTNDILIADEYYNHIVTVKAIEESVLMAGLDHPFHIHLDRYHLVVTNQGTNEILVGDLRGGTVYDIKSVPPVLGMKFKKPHGVFQGNGYSMIADTDNHRVLWKKGHFFDTGHGSTEWAEIKTRRFNFPCAVFADKGGWIADSFNGKVLNVVLDHTEKINWEVPAPNTEVIERGTPISICSWYNHLFVSDADSSALQLWIYDEAYRGYVLATPSYAGQFIGCPAGLSINRRNKLLVSDITKGCCWAIDIKSYLCTERQ